MRMGKVINKANGEIWVVAIGSKMLPPLEDGDSILEVDFDAMPDKDFRDCWKVEDEELKIDLPLARAKRLAQLREERDAALVELDATQMRLQSMPDTEAELAALYVEKQALRDMPVKAEADLAGKLAVTTIKAYSLDNALETE